MVARDVERAAGELRVLRHDEWERLGLVALAFGLALAASQVRPTFAVPLLVSGLSAVVLSVRALWRRWELLDRLVLDRDAYAIPEVRARAERAASLKNRHALASSARGLVREPGLALSRRVAAAADELEALASELDDSKLVLEPRCAVLCERLLTDGSESPLLNPALPPEDVRSRLRQIRAGFERRRLAA